MKHTFTLNRAHKIVNRLKDDINATNAACSPIMPFAFPLKSTFEQDIVAAADNYVDSINSIVKMQELVLDIRTKISNENTKQGVSAKMTEIEYHSSMIGILNQKLAFATSSVVLDDVMRQYSFFKVAQQSTDPVLHATKNGYEMWARANKYRLISEDDLKQLAEIIETHRAIIRRLGDEISDLNRATIEVEIDDEISKKLGLIS